MKRHHAYRFSLTACAAAFHTLVCRLLVGLAVLGCPPPVSGQEPPCKTWVDCSNLRVEVVLQDPYNLSPDCAGAASTSACGGGSNFTHLFYTVRLKYTPTSLNEDLDFYLRYEELYVAVRLAVSGASPVLFSQIDTKVTKSCYDNGPGANWGANGINGAIFTPQTSAVDIHFQNFQAGETCTDADLIHFMPADCTPNDPNEDFDCAYADLFIVAVRAYPGESIQVVCQGGPTFDPGPGVGPCNIGCNYVPNQAVQAALPAAPSGSPNSDLRVQLANPVQAPDGSCTIDIELANSGTSAVVLYYGEFVLQVSADQAMQPFEMATTYEYRQYKQGLESYYHFVVSGLAIPVTANGKVSLGTLTVHPAILQNQSWSVQLRLIDEGKARQESGEYLGSTTACSALPLDLTAKLCSHSGDEPCGTSPVLFKIWTPENVSVGCPSTKKVKVGLVAANPSVTTIAIEHFQFALRFDLSHGAAITGANMNPMSDPARDFCSATEPSGCLAYFGNSQTDCWEQEGDAVFQYCFNRQNTGAYDLDVSGDGAYLEIEFNTLGCINGVTLTNLALELENQAPCIPPQAPLPAPFTMCEPLVYGRVATEAGAGVQGVAVRLQQTENSGGCDDTSCPAQQKNTTDAPEAGNYSFCPCGACTKFSVTPYKNNDPLNGVSTYDLVLINKHILGSMLLDSPYKIIAADANKNYGVSTADIIELRKLILGFPGYTNGLPNNTSWRFVDADYVFPNPSSPFQPAFPENREVDLSQSSFQEANFVAIKVGDVNGNAMPSAAPLPVVSLAVPTAAAYEAGQIVTVPVRYSGPEVLEAIQLGLRFDASRLKLLGPSQGDLPGYHAGNFGLSRAGEGQIRTLWFADGSSPDQAIAPSAVLFHLTFLVQSAFSSSKAPLMQLDEAVLSNRAWKPDGQPFSLRLDQTAEDRVEQAIAFEGLLRAACRPNPASGAVQFDIHAAQPGRGRLGIFDAYGRMLQLRDLELQAGEQTVQLSEFGQLPAGVYLWKVWTPRAKVQGHLVKL